MKQITVWRTVTSDGAKLNHIEDGWSEYDKPQPIKKEFTNQLAWQNMVWIKECTHLKDGKVI